MSRLERRSITVTADPAAIAGAASADATLELNDTCTIYAVRLTYTGLPGTTDLTLTDDYANGSTVLAVANSNTSKLFYARTPAQKASDGTNSTLTEVAPVADRLRIQIAQGDPSGTVLVEAYVQH
jgi:hypothetical protein